MKSLKHYFTLTCSVLLILGLSTAVLAQGQQEEHLVGWWTFEDGVELEDLMGNFADITLMGAKVDDGKLDVSTGEWAIALEYAGPDIANKTLVSWAILEDLDVQMGSILTINRLSDPTFDGIVFGERQPQTWMAGSGWFHRTQDFDPGFAEKDTGELIYMAISYEEDGEARVIGYHNGELIGDYTLGQFEPFLQGDTAAIWGKRHDPAGGPGDLDALIEDSRIYDTVLTHDEIKELEPNTLAVEARGKLATLWGAMKAK